MRIQREKLAAAMARRYLNNKQLSVLAGVSRSTISAIKGGKRCSPDIGRKLAAILGDEILEQDDSCEQ